MNRRANLVIFGDRTAEEVLEAAVLSLSDSFERIERRYYDPSSFRNEAAQLESNVDCVCYCVGIANDSLKMEVVAACEQVGWKPVTIIHPSAQVATTAKVDIGVYVGPCAVISSHAHVERHSIIHIHASIGHDSCIGEFSAILPGARISGNVSVGQRTLVGSNAFVGAGVELGNDCRIDALSYVRNNVPHGHISSPRLARPIPRYDLRHVSE